MSKEDFRSQFPGIDTVTLWYLEETVYCLEHYVGMSHEDACDVVISSRNLKEAIVEYPELLQEEDGFYWAMLLVQREFWWHDKRLSEQHKAYLRERHHPPRDEL